jgi:hypothetical protein
LTVQRVNLAELEQTIRHLRAAAEAVRRHHGDDESQFNTLELVILCALADLVALHESMTHDKAAA